MKETGDGERERDDTAMRRERETTSKRSDKSFRLDSWKMPRSE